MATADVPEPMAAKAKANLPAGWTPSSLDAETIQDIGTEQVYLLEAAEEIAARAVDGIDPSPSEFAILRRVYPNEKTFRKQWRLAQSNIKTRRELQAKAGPATLRQAHRAEAEAAAQELEGQQVESDAIIRAERQKIAVADTKAAQARSVVDAEEVAVKALQSERLFPQHRLDEIQTIRNRWKNGKGHNLEVARQRLAVLAGLSVLDVSERRRVPGGFDGGGDLEVVRSVIEGLTEFGPDEMSRLKAFGMITERTEGYWHDVRVVPDALDRAKWRQYLDAEVAAEVARLRKEITALEAEEIKHREATAALTDFYVPT